MGKGASLKEIESYLHPCPKVNGVDILHSHQGQYVYFDAWKGRDKLNLKQLSVHRQNILCWEKADFYKNNADNLEWLTKEG